MVVLTWQPDVAPEESGDFLGRSEPGRCAFWCTAPEQTAVWAQILCLEPRPGTSVPGLSRRAAIHRPPRSPGGGKTSAGRPCGRSAGRAVSHAITNTSGVWPCHPHGCPRAARPTGWLAAPPRPPSATHGVSWCSANQRGEAARSVSPAYPLPCFMRPWQSAGRISTSTPRPPPLPTPGTLAATRVGILESPPRLSELWHFRSNLGS